MPDKCPSAADLLAYALGRHVEIVGRSVQWHLGRCERCRNEVVALRRAARQLRAQAPGPGPVTEQCLDEVAIAQLVEGTLDPEHRSQLMTHLAACSTCRAAVASLSGHLAEPGVRAEVVKVAASTWRSRTLRLAGLGAAGLAAAAVVLLVVSRPWQVEAPTPAGHRELTLTLSVPPEAVEPAGAVQTPRAFVWTSVPRTSRYHVTLFDAQGSVVWETETADTSTLLPGSVVLRAGSPYFWKVRARTGWDRWSESGLVEFTVMVPSEREPR